MNTSKTHWTGPYGILVPNFINQIPAIDGFNKLYKDGEQTEKACDDPAPTASEYKAKYAEVGSDGRFYWRINDYWIGPYGIRVPTKFTWIIATDGYNTLRSDGHQTSRNREDSIDPMEPTEDQYKKMYTMFSNGYYYWKQ